ncbi:MmpS family transport accessory protein [Streptomyces sp. NPDC002073]|uniref:MmpS family transport accessory protein n=1 Tax=Streptomyces sp. NBC_00239 TaxID=2903640 RepID=UPI002E288192|nr:MmpS family transport accessory protein [Streptomyces sp. NBC_00239]
MAVRVVRAVFGRGTAALVGVGLVMAAVGGCGAQKALEEETKKLEAEADRIEKETDQMVNGTFEVVYIVTGSGKVSEIGWLEGSGGQTSSKTLKDQTVPWEKKLTMKGVTSIPSVNVILGEKGGTADCVILVNGKEAKRATANGAFGMASCIADPGIAVK